MKRVPLRKLRKKARLTQAALGAAVGKPQSFISKLETGVKTDLTVTEAERIAASLHVSVNRIQFFPGEAPAS